LREPRCPAGRPVPEKNMEMTIIKRERESERERERERARTVPSGLFLDKFVINFQARLKVRLIMIIIYYFWFIFSRRGE
jgi:hypothetical protein